MWRGKKGTWHSQLNAKWLHADKMGIFDRVGQVHKDSSPPCLLLCIP